MFYVFYVKHIGGWKRKKQEDGTYIETDQPGDISWGRVKKKFETAPEAKDYCLEMVREGKTMLAGIWETYNRGDALPLWYCRLTGRAKYDDSKK